MFDTDFPSSGLGYWQDANVLSALANLDYFTKTKTNQQAVTNSLNAAFSLYTDYDQYGCVYPGVSIQFILTYIVRQCKFRSADTRAMMCDMVHLLPVQ